MPPKISVNKRFLASTVMAVAYHNQRNLEDACWSIHEGEKKALKIAAEARAEDPGGVQ